MSLSAGSRIGHYEIVQLIGAGGMGEVYRARDPRLARDVAIKVIPASFSTDGDRLRRFEQEARAAAALSHPNILAVHDVGAHDRAPYIVSELLAGMSLRERLAGGPLPVRKAVEIATQIARGLEAAHQKGIAHRDLKPENVFITDAGLVKILDFGLAKLTEAAPVVADTATAARGTEPGAVMGSPGYMSPEQLRGLAVDHRTDIFAFGTVLYELLAGARAFRGETSMDVATAILTRDPPDLPVAERGIPPALARIVDRCLEKNSSARFQSAGDLAFALESLSASSGSTAVMPATGSPVSSHSRGVSWLIAAIVGAALGAGAMYAVGRLRQPVPPPRNAVAFPLTFPPDVSLAAGIVPGLAGTSLGPMAVSPNGQIVALVANRRDGTRSLWVRTMNDSTPRPLAGTDGAMSPFWSPDNAQLAFFAGGKLKRVVVAGGPPIDLCDATNALGGSWSRESGLIFAIAGAGILRVPESGGTPVHVTTLAKGEMSHSRPIFLPDGRRFLFRVLSEGLPIKGWVHVASIGSTNRTPLIETESSNTVYSAGHLLFLRGSTLMAQGFDAARVATRGDAFPVVEGIAAWGSVPAAVFSASAGGVLVYQPGSAVASSELAWVTRAGEIQRRLGEPAIQSDLRLSRDGTRAVVHRRSASDVAADIWILDAATGAANRFTFDAANELTAVWSPDGRQLAFNSSKRGVMDLYVKPADGSAGEKELLVDQQNKYPSDWSPDGRHLLYVSITPGAGGDASSQDRRGRGAQSGDLQRLWILPMEGDRKPFPLTSGGNIVETPGGFSPDGRWIAYAASESAGRSEIYVTPFPSTGAKWQISTAGGALPRWSRDGREIFFVHGGPLSETLMSARVDGTGAALQRLAITPLFRIAIAGVRSAYAPAPDGKRFLVNAPARDSVAATAPIVVLDWPALRPGS